MSFEISDGRTPPNVTLSVSPTTFERDFNFTQNPPIMLNSERFKDVSNLKVNQRRSRSFTPVKGALYLRSPELSPIGVTNIQLNTDNGNDFLTPGNFKAPQPMIKTNESTTPTGPPNVQPKHQLHRHDGNHLGTPTVNCPEDPNQTQNLDESASHGYLNHKLEVRLVLKNACMQQYIEAFNKEKIDFAKFLTLCDEDLLRLGVKRKVDRKVISSIINALNSN